MDKSARVDVCRKAFEGCWIFMGARSQTAENVGQNLVLSNGEAFPKISLLAPSKDEDALRYAAAKYIAEQAQYLGIPFTVREVSSR